MVEVILEGKGSGGWGKENESGGERAGEHVLDYLTQPAAQIETNNSLFSDRSTFLLSPRLQTRCLCHKRQYEVRLTIKSESLPSSEFEARFQST